MDQKALRALRKMAPPTATGDEKKPREIRKRDTRAYHLLSPEELRKVDAEQRKAGVPPRGPAMQALLHAERQAIESPMRMPYERLLEIRMIAYRERLARLPIPQEIADWATRMTALHGPTLEIHHQRDVDWVTALVIARWGEDPEKWPAALGADDVLRALRWEERNVWPLGARVKKRELAAPVTLNVQGPLTGGSDVGTE